MCEVLQPFREGRKPLARVGCGELGGRAQLRESHCPGATITAVLRRKEDPCVAMGAACRQDKDPAGLCPFPRRTVLRCAPGRTGSQSSTFFPALATLVFPRMSQSPCGQSPLPPGSPHCLSPLSHPPGCLEQARPGPWDTQSGLAVLLPARAVPAGAQPVAGGERDSATPFRSATGEMG